MTQGSKERVLYATFLVSSLVISSSAKLEIFLLNNDEIDMGEPAVHFRDKIKAYDESKHGNVMFAIHSRGFPGKPDQNLGLLYNNESLFSFSANSLKCEMNASETMECKYKI